MFCFFQAGDVIRDRDVTGFQTCALPISLSACWFWHEHGLNALADVGEGIEAMLVPEPARGEGDRKSTRLKSSHITISYDVSGLKKTKHDRKIETRIDLKSHNISTFRTSH